MIHLQRRLILWPVTLRGHLLRLRRTALLGVMVAGSALISPAALAAPACTFQIVTAINFGAYNVYTKVANKNGVGNLTIQCRGGRGSFAVTLSTGQSNNYATRVMNSGIDLLEYNLYTSTARTTVWGDGTGGSSSLTAIGNSSTSLSVFGQIPAGQDAAVGNYTDNIIATVNF